MSILDSEEEICQNAENQIKAKALEDSFYAMLLLANVSEVETDMDSTWRKIAQTGQVNEESTLLVSKLVGVLREDYHTLNPKLKRHIGRPVYTLDCRHLHKGDAIGWLEKVASLPKSPKPILVIENITEVPEEDTNHDDPQYVRNLLMHSWKNPMNEFFNANSHNSFKIVPSDYKVFITWTPDKCEKMKAIHHPSDGFAWIGNLKEKYNKFLENHKNDSLKDLEDAHIISYRE